MFTNFDDLPLEYWSEGSHLGLMYWLVVWFGLLALKNIQGLRNFRTKIKLYVKTFCSKKPHHPGIGPLVEDLHPRGESHTKKFSNIGQKCDYDEYTFV